MKLLRLTTEENDGKFYNYFPDIIVNERSSIALQNISCSINPTVFTVNDSNNGLTFSIAGVDYDIELTNGDYNSSNYQTLFEEARVDLNKLLTFNGKLIGSQFYCGVDSKSNKVDLGFLSSPYNLNESLFRKRIVGGDISLTGAVGNKTISASTNTNITDDTRLYYSDYEFIKGCGVMRCALNLFTDSGSNDNGLFIGISSLLPSSWASAFTLDDHSHYIKLNRDAGAGGGFYITRNIGGGEVVSTKAYAVGDLIEINISEGKINGVIYTGANATNLFTIDYDNTTKFYPFVSFRSGGNLAKISNLRVQFDPSVIPSNSLSNEPETGITAPRPTPHLEVFSSYFFDSSELANFWGFKNRSEEVKGVNGLFEGDNEFDLSVFNDTYLILLDTLDIDSYDGFGGDRKNILAVIPYSDDKTNLKNVLEYEPNTLNFIEMKNRNKFSLRNIGGRILKSNLTNPSLTGLSSITVLIKDKDE